jgi:hypothetical protein
VTPSARHRVRPLALALALAGGVPAAPLAAQLPGQSFEVTPLRDSATIGDTVTLRLRVRLTERDRLVDSLPTLIGPPLRGARLLSVELLTRQPDRTYTGIARVAYYRPGRQYLPQFGVAFARVIQSISRAVIPSEPGSIEIVATLPPGEQPLKDIRPLQRQRGPRWPWLVAPVLGLGLFWTIARRRRRPAPERAAVSFPIAEPERPDPLQVAVDRLRDIESQQWPARGDTDHHYQAVADVIRDYLAEARQIAAREMTTSQLRRALSAAIPDGAARERWGRFLEQADLVKFAAARPGIAAAGEYLESARTLLAEWAARHTNGDG